MPTKDIYLVIGGSGFVGRHIVQQLLDRGDTVSVLDIVQRYHDVPFYSADISDQEQVASALRRSGTTCIIHTASPPAGLSDPALYWKVNVDGTKAVIAAAVECGVKKLVFTSSAGVVFSGSDLIDVDERLPPPERPMDAYNESKAKAEEAVLAANGKNGLLTVALRPAGIFGPGDRQVMAGLYRVFEDRKTHFQIGDNNNLFDWTYVGNVAHAHLLAADKLDSPPPAPPLGPLEKLPLEPPALTEAELELLTRPLPSIDLTVGRHRIPTSEARPLGPYVTPPPNAEKLVQAFESTDGTSSHPVVRTRFDQLSENSIARSKLHNPEVHPLQVAGQVFFITNGEPCYFWDLPRIIWGKLDAMFPGHIAKRQPWVMSRSIGLTLAYAAEWWGWLSGKEPSLTRFKVTYSCVNRWHNIEKARRVLGYEPKVGLQEGIDKLFEVGTYP
ncbi:erg26, C-3 sterol dehydrogenase [Paramarasmius palmivorus]|uniref:Erg26, C-3 sterol dehydrogenase n=1 Tax=Paramarasmius palmivorus TaxID=297713 RepID=A0AAW0DV73_9AGAR